MPVLFTNNASTTLSAGINNSTTTIAIASASGFPSLGSGEYYFGTIANTNNTKVEVVKVTAGTTSLTVTRAQDGTSAQAFDSGDNFQLRVTAATLDATSKSDVNITGGAIAGAAISNDAIDSQHYADGSIDLAHLSADCVDGTKIADDSINSEHYVDASIDTAHIGDDQVTADKLANSINTDIATGVTANTTANAALPKAGGAMTGAITTNSTFDGRDVATDGTKLDGIASSANNYTHPNHSGEVTSTADGATVIADNIVDEANLKVSNAPTNGYFLSAQSGNTGGMTWAEVDTTIANDSIDSQHYAAGSIDLEHLSSESVDEDNLYISNAGSNGQFLSKQSGNDGGLTWATVSSEDYIPDGSVMVFFQANAPTGWTKVTTQNDKTLRVVSGTGGGTGGDWAMSAGETTSSHGGHAHSSAAHTHGGGNLAAANHTLSTGQMPSHTHSATGGSGYGNGANWNSSGGGNTGATGGGGSHSHGMSGNTASTTPSDTGSAGSHTHTIAAPQYIDVIICSKDA